MDSMVKIFLERAKNELKIAEILLGISIDKNKKNIFEVKESDTFFSGAISHSYYCIFYSAKAVLLTKNIRTSSPRVHKKTYEQFKRHFVDSGIIDRKLLKIYDDLVVKANELLQIFKEEKWKRGHFTYKTIPQANRQPAEESVENAKVFLTNIAKFIG